MLSEFSSMMLLTGLMYLAGAGTSSELFRMPSLPRKCPRFGLGFFWREVVAEHVKVAPCS